MQHEVIDERAVVGFGPDGFAAARDGLFTWLVQRGAGTRPGHPERGEETFEVALRPSGEVVLSITGRSRPATWWARLGTPVTRLVQRRLLRAYLAALVTGRAYRGSHD